MPEGVNCFFWHFLFHLLLHAGSGVYLTNDPLLLHIHNHKHGAWLEQDFANLCKIKPPIDVLNTQQAS